MRASNIIHAVIVVAALLAGCESFEPVGAYAGDGTSGGQFQRIVTRPDAEGHLTVTSSSATESLVGVEVRVRRLSEDRLELRLHDGCRVTLEQSPEPNEHNTSVAWDDVASCDVALQGYVGPVRIGGGVVSFGREEGTIHVALSGGVPQAADPNAPGSVSGSWGYSFDGTRREP